MSARFFTCHARAQVYDTHHRRVTDLTVHGHVKHTVSELVMYHTLVVLKGTIQ